MVGFASFDNVTREFYSNFSDSKYINLGDSLWRTLQKIQEKYDEMPMTEFGNCLFSSNVWFGEEAETNINWGSGLDRDESNLPFVILMKLAVYNKVQIQKYTVKTYLTAPLFVKRWSPYLYEKRILTAKKGQPFLPLSVINKEMLHQWIVNEVEHGSLKSVNHISYWQSLIVNSSSFNAFEAPFYESNLIAPWSHYKKKGEMDITQNYLNDILGEKATRFTKQSYSPFSPEVVAKILDSAIPIVTEQQESYLEIFDVFKKYYPDSEKSRERLNNKKINVKKYFSEMNSVTRKNMDAINNFPLLAADLHGQFKFDKNRNELVGLRWVNELHQLCIASAIWVILFTTGLRNVDIRRSLMRDCVVKASGQEKLHYLVSDLKKVKRSDFAIPIPEITVKAISFLNKLNYAPSDPSRPDYVPELITRLRVVKDSEYWFIASNKASSDYLRNFAQQNSIDLLHDLSDEDNKDGVSHRCRVTLAGWIGTNSPLAVMIVRRLFGHTNDVMPDHYLKANPEVVKERQIINERTNDEFSGKLSDAIVTGNFSGGMKDQLRKDVEDLKESIQKNNKSLTEGEVRETLKVQLKKLFKERLINSDSLALMTPLGFVCMRNPTSIEPAPCSMKSQNKKMSESEIDKRFMRALQVSTLPNLDNCQGQNCKHSLLYDNEMTKLLLETFRYYVNYLKGVGTFNIKHLEDEARNFIDLYYPPLKDVYPEIEGLQ